MGRSPSADLPGANPANGDESEYGVPHPDAEPDLELAEPVAP